MFQEFGLRIAVLFLGFSRIWWIA